MRKQPDWRAKEVAECVRRKILLPENSPICMFHYYEYKTTKICSSDTALDAFYIYGDTIQKEILEALILTGAKEFDILRVFEVNPETLRTYKDLFFDISVFRSKLDILGYLEKHKDDFGKDLKVRAYNLGPEYVFYRYGRTVPSSDEQKTLLKRMFLISAYHGAEAMFHPTTSGAARAALLWSQNMIKAYEALEKFTNNEMPEDLDMYTIMVKHDLSISRCYVSVPTSRFVSQFLS